MIFKKYKLLRLLFILWSFLSKRRKYQFFAAILLMLASGFMEILTLSGIYPLLSNLSDNASINRNSFIFKYLPFLEAKSSNSVIVFAFLFIVICIFSSVIRLLNLWVNARVSALVGSDLSCMAYSSTLNRPYSQYIVSNSSDTINTITTQVQFVVSLINYILTFVTSFVVVISIAFSLFLINPTFTYISLFVFSFSYITVALLSNQFLKSNGQLAEFNSKQQLRSIQEGLGSFRDIILNSNRSFYIKSYRNYDLPLRFALANIGFLSSFPRFVLESFGLILLAVLGILFYSRTNLNLIASLGVLALGAQKLLPSLQQIYVAWANLNGFTPALQSVISLIQIDQDPVINPNETVLNEKCNIIKFSDVYYKYPSSSNFSLKQIQLSISYGEKIGISGLTGSGKSTFLDVFMGLLPPTRGNLSVNNASVWDNSSLLNYWRSNISHVPQKIYLKDASIAENIAFCDDLSNIDFQLLHKSVLGSQLFNYISTLPDGLYTRVGECGISLSGGQIQRIGIARALYYLKDYLVLDEATSALDQATEELILDYLFNLPCTIIMVTHSFSRLSYCHRIINVQNNSLAFDGSYKSFALLDN